MTTEEKAKRFDEVVEEFRGLLEGVHEDKCDIMEEDILKILPELKRSEDERIRKELLEHCKNQAKPYIQTGNKCPQIQSWIDWLEKQGQKPTTDIQNLTWEDIEKIGEFINIVQNENPNGIGAECLYTDVLERFLDGKQTKQKPVEWSDEDKGNLLDVKCIIDEVWHSKDFSICYSTEELESLWHWLDDIWQRVEYPQNTWKPSEEHIRYLQAVVNDVHNIGSESCSIVLRDLLGQLKKL